MEAADLRRANANTPLPYEKNANRPERTKGRGPRATLGMAGRGSNPENTPRLRGARVHRVGVAGPDPSNTRPDGTVPRG
eukprot:4603008-Lingulodinium_polyedra.AAC.1